MSEISDYVDLTITVATAAPGIPNFGSLLLAGNSTSGDAGLHLLSATPTGIKAYETEYSGDVDDVAYKMLSAIVGQTPHVDQVKWYNTKSAFTYSLAFTPLAPFTVGKVYKLSINGTQISYTVETGDTATEIATALHTLADALDGVTSTDSESGTFTLSGTYAYVVGASPKQFTIQQGSSAAADLSNSLDAALAADPDFYGVIVDVDVDTQISDAAAWTETNRKMLFARTKGADALAGNGVLDTLFQAGYHRTALIYSGDDTGRLDAAIAGRFLATDPGQSDVQFKNHPGVTVDDLSAAQISAFKAKNGITYTSTLGVVFTDNGVAVSGRPLAVTRNVDWLEARIRQAALTEFVNSEIILISDEGIAQFDKMLRAVMAEAERKKVILPGWTVTAPKLADITTAEANNGLIPGFTFAAVTGKAARKVQINGTLT